MFNQNNGNQPNIMQQFQQFQQQMSRKGDPRMLVQQALMGGINGLTSAVSSGFANAEISRCNGMTNVLQAMNANQAANTANVNALAMALTAPSK